MEIRTHRKTDPTLCGEPLEVRDGYSRVKMTLNDRMSVDATGLVHGGFVFGLADYAAMIAVNHPNVVLGSAEVKFLKPLKSGDVVTAEADVEEVSGKKQVARVTVSKNAEEVFTGKFVCFVLDRHVLA